MEKSPSWEANWFSDSQEFSTLNGIQGSLPRLQPPPGPVLSQINPIHALPTPFLKIHLNIILPSIPGSSKWSLSLRFPPPKNPVCTSPLLHVCYMAHPSRSSSYYHPNNIWWAVQIIKLLIMYFSLLPCYLIPLRPKYSPKHPVFTHPQSTCLSQCKRPSFTPIQNNRQNYISVYLNLCDFG